MSGFNIERRVATAKPYNALSALLVQVARSFSLVETFIWRSNTPVKLRLNEILYEIYMYFTFKSEFLIQVSTMNNTGFRLIINRAYRIQNILIKSFQRICLLACSFFFPNPSNFNVSYQYVLLFWRKIGHYQIFLCIFNESQWLKLFIFFYQIKI